MSTSLADRRAALLKEARDLLPAEGTKMSGETAERVSDLMDQADALAAEIKAAEDSAALVSRVFDANPEGVSEVKGGDSDRALSLGEHFIKNAGAKLKQQAAGSHMDISTPEWKAPSDPILSPVDGVDAISVYGTEFRRSIVNQHRRELVIADLMGVASITTRSIAYMVEKPNSMEGAPATVAEGALKPSVRWQHFDMVTEALSKIAAVTKLADEMLEDFAFIKTWIDNRLIAELSLVEEEQLLRGDGTGSNLTGLLNRSGLQQHDIAAGEEFDGLFTAMKLVPQATGLHADAIVVNPADYIRLRLQRDGNSQYYAGGPFQGQYGNGGILLNPAVWGLRTVDSPAMDEGRYVLGSFKTASTVLRHGGLRIESTNTNEDDFVHNLATLRAEERLGLMVDRPAAFVTGTIGAAAGA